MSRIVFEEFVSSPWDSTTPLCRVDDTGWVTWINPHGRGDWKDAPGKLARAALKAAVAKLAHDKQNPVLERKSDRKTSGRVRVMPDGNVFEEDTQLNKWFSASDYNDVSALRNAIAVLTTTLGLILNATDHSIPQMDGAKFVRFVPDPWDPALHPEEQLFAWAIYICHDTCHDAPWQSAPVLEQNDAPAHYADRNVVIALHRCRGIFRVIGRELDTKTAMNIVIHGHPTAWEASE